MSPSYADVEVLVFAAVRQRVGQPSVRVPVESPATIRGLRRELVRLFPEFAGMTRHSLFAIGQDYVDDDASIPLGAAVAWIPPVSGG